MTSLPSAANSLLFSALAASHLPTNKTVGVLSGGVKFVAVPTAHQSTVGIRHRSSAVARSKLLIEFWPPNTDENYFMQQSIVQIRDKLLAGLDQDYNVVDPQTVVEVLTQLESYSITKEALEATRLGKHINGLRRSTKDQSLANRAKNLVKKWRKLLVNPTASNGGVGVAPSTQTHSSDGGGGLAPQTVNGAVNPRSRLASPALLPLSNSNSRSAFTTPSTSPAASLTAINGAYHPAVNNYNSSLPSSRGGSPNNADGRTSLNHSPTSRPSSPYNHFESGVPRTNAANKRLRKIEEEENGVVGESPAKRSRTSLFANGDVGHGDENSNGPSDIVGEYAGRNGNNGVARNNKRSASSRPGSARVSPSYPVVGTPGAAGGGPANVLDQQMQSVRKKGKVKTTQEIVQELAMRSGSPGLPPRGGGGQSLPESSKEDLVNKFLAAAAASSASASSASSPLLANGSSRGSPLASASASRSSSRPLTPSKGSAAAAEPEADSLESVLAQLPPLDVAETLAFMEENATPDLSEEVEADNDDVEIEGLIPIKRDEDDEEKDEKVSPVVVDEEMVERLHEKDLENVNGNTDHEGVFREWHEVLTKESLNGDLIYVLPYSVID